MRATSSMVLTVTLLLAACGGGSQSSAPAAGAAPAQAQGPAVTGTALFEQPVALSPGASLDVRLLDITRVDAEPILITEGKFPIQAIPAEFRLPYDAAAINPIRTYAIDVTVMDNNAIRFLSQGRVGVLTQNKSGKVTVMLAQGLVSASKDPAVELIKEFNDFEARLGGLKRFADSRIIGPEGKETAIGWDAFADETGVRMVREQIVNPDQSRSSRRFAFKDDKLWVAVREIGGGTVQLGWDKDGQVIVNLRNGQADPSVAEQAPELTRLAREARDIAAARAPR
jgi:uncharacterized lipoprotein YbaY